MKAFTKNLFENLDQGENKEYCKLLVAVKAGGRLQSFINKGYSLSGVKVKVLCCSSVTNCFMNSACHSISSRFDIGLFICKTIHCVHVASFIDGLACILTVIALLCDPTSPPHEITH